MHRFYAQTSAVARLICSRTRAPLFALLFGAPVYTALAEDAMPALTTVGINSIAVCYNFACNERSHVSLSQQEWAQVAGWFHPPARNGEQEREQIRHAVGWMEELVGRYTPTHRDVAGNLPDNAQMPGQLDCIDESRNTTTYLKLLQANALLRFHRVVERAYRRALFDQHWSGQIEELASGERYVVDSWFQDNGMLPYIQTAKSWRDIPVFTSFVDNSGDSNRRREGTTHAQTGNMPEAGIAGDTCHNAAEDCVARNGSGTSLRE